MPIVGKQERSGYKLTEMKYKNWQIANNDWQAANFATFFDPNLKWP